MNAYPSELQAQLYPLMFVAGLEQVPGGESATPNDPFIDLFSRLKETFDAQRRPPSIWNEPEKRFNILLVEKNVKFPPRKNTTSGHSPLSPLTPESPLHPDGLIAPIWLRKHVLLLPSVFVLFLLLPEPPPVNSPLESGFSSQFYAQLDSGLAGEIAARKKACSDRQIKLTVVLVTSRQTMDDPSLDARLSAIRRQSSLDSRAALFVLSPVSSSELLDFTNSLQNALLPAAVEYYTMQSKRVRKKRNALSNPSSSYINPSQPALPPAGWSIRYEYKQACFAELRGEREVALKHYVQALFLISEYLGATLAPGTYVVPPRTKRWAEAKVLADCISIKILAHHLSPPAAPRLTISHFNTHVSVISGLSRGWGMTDEGWELWSWRSRQFRILADMLMACPSPPFSYTSLPSSSPLPQSTSASTVDAPSSRQSLDTVNPDAQGVNPATHLSHPGFYYWMAAECIMLRRKRFLEAGGSNNPSYTNELKVDHLAIALDLYTKAFEAFKLLKTEGDTNDGNRNKLTLLLAFKITKLYGIKEERTAALKLFPRIANTYRSTHFNPLLVSVLEDWRMSNQGAAVDASALEVLIELVGQGGVLPESSHGDLDLQSEVIASIGKLSLNASEPLTLSAVAGNAIFEASVVFYSSTAIIGNAVPVQVCWRPRGDVNLATIPIRDIGIKFFVSGPEGERLAERTLVVRCSGSHVDSEADSANFGQIDLHHEPTSDPLLMEVPSRRYFEGHLIASGTVSTSRVGKLTVSSMFVTLQQDNSVVRIPFDPSEGKQLQWIDSTKVPPSLRTPFEMSRSCQFYHATHLLSLDLRHEGVALMGERYAVSAHVINRDVKPLDLSLNVLLAPGEGEAVDYLFDDEHEEATNMIRRKSLGLIQPGQSTEATFFLVCNGNAVDRVIDVSIQSENASEQLSDKDNQELLKTIAIPVEEPFTASFDVEYHMDPLLAPMADFAELKSDVRLRYVAEVSVALAGNSGDLDLIGISTEVEPSSGYVIRYSSVEVDGFPQQISQQCAWAFIVQIELPEAAGAPETSPASCTVHWRRHSSAKTVTPSTTSFLLPTLKPFPQELVAFLDIPPIGRLHQPIFCQLTLLNNQFARTAELELQFDASDAFVVSGLRHGVSTPLLPSTSLTLDFTLMPLMCGTVEIPPFRILDKQGSVYNEDGSEKTGPRPVRTLLLSNGFHGQIDAETSKNSIDILAI